MNAATLREGEVGDQSPFALGVTLQNHTHPVNVQFGPVGTGPGSCLRLPLANVGNNIYRNDTQKYVYQQDKIHRNKPTNKKQCLPSKSTQYINVQCSLALSHMMWYPSGGSVCPVAVVRHEEAEGESANRHCCITCQCTPSPAIARRH